MCLCGCIGLLVCGRKVTCGCGSGADVLESGAVRGKVFRLCGLVVFRVVGNINEAQFGSQT